MRARTRLHGNATRTNAEPVGAIDAHAACGRSASASKCQAADLNIGPQRGGQIDGRIRGEEHIVHHVRHCSDATTTYHRTPVVVCIPSGACGTIPVPVVHRSSGDGKLQGGIGRVVGQSQTVAQVGGQWIIVRIEHETVRGQLSGGTRHPGDGAAGDEIEDTTIKSRRCRPSRDPRASSVQCERVGTIVHRSDRASDNAGIGTADNGHSDVETAYIGGGSIHRVGGHGDTERLLDGSCRRQKRVDGELGSNSGESHPTRHRNTVAWQGAANPPGVDVEEHVHLSTSDPAANVQARGGPGAILQHIEGSDGVVGCVEGGTRVQGHRGPRSCRANRTSGVRGSRRDGQGGALLHRHGRVGQRTSGEQKRARVHAGRAGVSVRCCQRPGVRATLDDAGESCVVGDHRREGVNQPSSRIAGEGERARRGSLVGKCGSAEGQRAAGLRRRGAGGVQRGPIRTDGEGTVGGRSDAGVAQRATIDNEVRGSIGRCSDAAGYATIAQGTDANNAAVDGRCARVIVGSAQGQCAGAFLDKVETRDACRSKDTGEDSAAVVAAHGECGSHTTIGVGQETCSCQ